MATAASNLTTTCVLRKESPPETISCSWTEHHFVIASKIAITESPFGTWDFLML